MHNLNSEWCLHCGMQNWSSKGKSAQGKQRLLCKNCNVSITINSALPSERKPNYKKFLPVLLKNCLSLSKEELYSLGVLIADGGRKGKDNIDNMCLSLTAKDRSLIEIVHQSLSFPNCIKDYSRNKKNLIEHYCEISWSNKWAGPYWDSLGLIRNKTGNEMWLPYMNSWHFIRGFLDGDGCIYNGKRFRIEFYCANKNFLINLFNNINPYLFNNKMKLYKKNKGKKDWFQLYFSDKEALLLGDFLYKDSDGLRLERKYQKYLEIKNNVKR
jgi:hypothetical protein